MTPQQYGAIIGGSLGAVLGVCFVVFMVIPNAQSGPYIDYNSPYTQRCYILEYAHCQDAHDTGSDYCFGEAANHTGRIDDYVTANCIMKNESCGDAWKFCYTY